MAKKPYYQIYIDRYRGENRVVSLKDLGKTAEEIEQEIYDTIGPVRPPERGHFQKLIQDELNEK
jgi:hypothetical protein